MPNPEREALRASAFHVSAAAHVFALVAAILLLVWTIHFRGGLSLRNDNLEHIINAHAVIMFMGFLLVSGEAIMVYNAVRAAKKVQKVIHMCFQLFAIAMAVFGINAAFKFHDQSEIPNMYSLHSWLGIISICLFCLQWLLGFFIFWFPKAAPPMRARAIPWHGFAGMTAFVLATCSAQTGLMQKGIVGPGTELRVINFTAISILLFVIAVCLSAVLPRFIVRS